jgi:hypothetical protein
MAAAGSKQSSPRLTALVTDRDGALGAEPGAPLRAISCSCDRLTSVTRQLGARSFDGSAREVNSPGIQASERLVEGECDSVTMRLLEGLRDALCGAGRLARSICITY